MGGGGTLIGNGDVLVLWHTASSERYECVARAHCDAFKLQRETMRENAAGNVH